MRKRERKNPVFVDNKFAGASREIGKSSYHPNTCPSLPTFLHHPFSFYHPPTVLSLHFPFFHICESTSYLILLDMGLHCVSVCLFHFLLPRPLGSSYLKFECLSFSMFLAPLAEVKNSETLPNQIQGNKRNRERRTP